MRRGECEWLQAGGSCEESGAGGGGVGKGRDVRAEVKGAISASLGRSEA